MTKQDLILAFSRRVDVPADALYAGWTDADLLKQWFTPAPWKTIDAYIEAFPGGAFRTVFQSPEGQVVDNGEGCFFVTETNKRLVWTNMMAAGFQPNPMPEGSMPMTVSLRFEVDDRGCNYHVEVRHASVKDRETHEAMGFYEGWGLALDQLIALIHSKKAAKDK